MHPFEPQPDEQWVVDYYCCAGGATEGYRRAGFKVVGFDKDPQPNYCGDAFIQAEVLTEIKPDVWVPTPQALAVIRHPAVVAGHASPPCQGETVLQFVNQNRDAHPRLIDQTRWMLRMAGKPYVIENVVGAKLEAAVTLCGEMFGLGVIRHRLFETNWPHYPPPHPKHRGRVRGWNHGTYYDGPYVAVYGKGGGKATLAEASAAMGIDWMTYDEIVEAIPPAYTEHIGNQLLAHLTNINQQEAA